MNEIEAIENLEGYCKWCNAQGGQCQLNLDGCTVGDALALLKEKPEPAELTKNILANLTRWKPALDKIDDCRFRTIISYLKEVCLRYDYVVGRNAKLRAELDARKG